LIAPRFSNLLTAGCCTQSGPLRGRGENQMRRTQKRLHTRTSFSFGESELTYRFEHRGSIQERVVDYFELVRSRRHTALRDWSRFQLGSLLAIAGGIAVVAQARLAGFDALTMAWLLPGGLYLSLFLFRQSHFLVLEAAGEPLWIIDDASRQSIVAECDRRRRERLSDIYGQLNLANEGYLEIRKIEWLVTESVLTREQADDQIRMVNGVAIARAEARQASQAVAFEPEAIAV
jgi:hypothetical protein